MRAFFDVHLWFVQRLFLIWEKIQVRLYITHQKLPSQTVSLSEGDFQAQRWRKPAGLQLYWQSNSFPGHSCPVAGAVADRNAGMGWASSLSQHRSSPVVVKVLAGVSNLWQVAGLRQRQHGEGLVICVHHKVTVDVEQLFLYSHSWYLYTALWVSAYLRNVFLQLCSAMGILLHSLRYVYTEIQTD